MAGVTVNILSQDIRTIESDAIVACFFEDVRPLKGVAGRLDWILCGALSRLIIDKRISGSQGDMALLTTKGKLPALKLFLVGMGSFADFSLAALGSVARTAGAGVANAGARTAVMEYIRPEEASDAAGILALQYGLQEGAGGRTLAVSLLAPDAASRDMLAAVLRGTMAAEPS